MLHMQDTFNLLYNSSSSDERGKLANMRTLFNFQGVRAKVSEAFNNNEELLRLATRGLIVLTAMDLLDLKDQDQKLDEDADVKQVFMDTAKSVTTFFWQQC